MPAEVGVVASLPMKHYIEYASCVAIKVIQNSLTQSVSARVLTGDEATPRSTDSAINELNPKIVIAVGHGTPESVSLECGEMWLTVDNVKYRDFRNKVLFVNSCKAGSRLGIEIVKRAGASAFIGNKDDYLFLIALPPCSCREVMSPFIAEYKAIEVLLRGGSASEAHEARLKAYDDEINYWTFGGGKDSPYAQLLGVMLQYDKSIAVVHLAEAVRRVLVPLKYSAIFSIIPITFGTLLIYSTHSYKSAS